MWLASVSMRKDGRLLNTEEWRHRFDWAYKKLRLLLRGVGDDRYERTFRMCATLCLHRAATGDEILALPESWQKDLSGLAGGPVECLWSKGIPESPSLLPCENPGKKLLEMSRPDLYVPIDCGTCAPCLARAHIVGTDRREIVV